MKNGNLPPFPWGLSLKPHLLYVNTVTSLVEVLFLTRSCCVTQANLNLRDSYLSLLSSKLKVFPPGLRGVREVGVQIKEYTKQCFLYEVGG